MGFESVLAAEQNNKKRFKKVKILLHELTKLVDVSTDKP